MSIDVESLSPAPWMANSEEVCRDNPLVRWLSHGSPWKGGYQGTDRAKADAQFIALARNAFDVMMRREWHSECIHGKGWRVRIPCADFVHYWNNPFTALIEADRWYRENVEKT